MAKVGYARVSTQDQNLHLQIDALKEEGCTKIFEEHASGKDTERPQLQEMLKYIREGDTVVVYKLDRLGRSTKDLISLVDDFRERGVEFVSVHDRIDTSTPMGTFVFTVFSALAELERSMIIERTQAGLAAARARGRKGGRPVAMSKQEKEAARRMVDVDEMSITDALKALNRRREKPVSRATFTRAIAEARAATSENA